jgi:hypothetical protein
MYFSGDLSKSFFNKLLFLGMIFLVAGNYRRKQIDRPLKRFGQGKWRIEESTRALFG